MRDGTDPRTEAFLTKEGPATILPHGLNRATWLFPRPAWENTMSELTKAVTDDSFKQDVLEAPGPVLVDFWAEWCGPCRLVGPILDEIAKEYQGKLTVAKVNIDDNPMTPNDYAV